MKTLLIVKKLKITKEIRDSKYIICKTNNTVNVKIVNGEKELVKKVKDNLVVIFGNYNQKCEEEGPNKNNLIIVDKKLKIYYHIYVVRRYSQSLI